MMNYRMNSGNHRRIWTSPRVRHPPLETQQPPFVTPTSNSDWLLVLGLSQNLSQRISPGRAKIVSFTAKPLMADKAYEWGLQEN